MISVMAMGYERLHIGVARELVEHVPDHQQHVASTDGGEQGIVAYFVPTINEGGCVLIEAGPTYEVAYHGAIDRMATCFADTFSRQVELIPSEAAIDEIVVEYSPGAGDPVEFAFERANHDVTIETDA